METINIGTAPNSKDGDKNRIAFTKVNNNFNEVSDKLTELTASSITVSSTPPEDPVIGTLWLDIS